MADADISMLRAALGRTRDELKKLQRKSPTGRNVRLGAVRVGFDHIYAGAFCSGVICSGPTASVPGVHSALANSVLNGVSTTVLEVAVRRLQRAIYR